MDSGGFAPQMGRSLSLESCTRSGPHAMRMGKVEDRHRLTVVRRLCGQVSTGPSGASGVSLLASLPGGVVGTAPCATQGDGRGCRFSRTCRTASTTSRAATPASAMKCSTRPTPLATRSTLADPT